MNHGTGKHGTGNHGTGNHGTGKPRPALRFGLIGCGRIAQSHLDAMRSVYEAELSLVVEPREDAAGAVAEEHSCTRYSDYRDPAICDQVDAVIICTPPRWHFEIASYFLERGIHVLCEKPLTIRASHAVELVKLSEEKGCQLMMASKFRYVDDVIKAKALIESGILGDLILYENTFCGKVSMKDRWNSDPDIAGGGVLIDNGSHSVDIARYLLGPLKDVQAQKGIRAQGLGVEDTVRLQFRTETGVIGMVDLSWSINKESDHYISLFGSEGTLLIGWTGSRYRQDGNSKWVTFGSGYSKLDAFRRQLENFVACVHGDESPLIPPDAALASVQVIEAAYVSASKDNWVSVGESLETARAEST